MLHIFPLDELRGIYECRGFRLILMYDGAGWRTNVGGPLAIPTRMQATENSIRRTVDY